MATSFDTFRLPQTCLHSQFIPYSPPAPKPPSRCYSQKNASSLADGRHDIGKILGIGPGSNTQPRDRGVLAPTSHGAKAVELTCLDGGINDEIGDGGGNGGRRGDGGDDDDFFCSQDERENVGPKQREPPGKMDAKRRDKNLNQPTTVESSQENAIIFDDDQVEPDSDVDSDDRPPWEDDTSTRTGSQLECSEMSTLECLGKGSPPTDMKDVINSEMAKGARSQDDLLPCTSDDDHLPMSDTKCRDTPKRHRMNSDIDGDAPSHHFTDRPTQGASGHTHLNATAHRPQPPGEKKANRQSEFTALEDVSGGSNGDNNDNDGDGDDKNENCATAGSLLTRKRKRSEHAARSAGRQKPSPFRGRPLSNDNFSSDNSSDESDKESGHRRRRLPNNERLKSTASLGRSRKHNSKRGRCSVWPSRSNTESTSPSSTLSPHAAAEIRPWPSAEGALPRQAQRQLPDFTIHPLSSNIAFLTALVRDFSDMGTFSISQAVTLLESHVGHPAKLNNVTVKPLPSNVWFLTCLIHHSCDTADFLASYTQLNKTHHHIDQSAPALPGLPATRAGVVAPRDDDTSDDDDEDLSDIGGERSSSTVTVYRHTGLHPVWWRQPPSYMGNESNLTSQTLLYRTPYLCIYST